MNLFASLMRTVVPVLVGLVLGLAARVGLDVDSTTVAMVVTAGLTAAYYAVFRLLEDLAARLEWRPLQLLAGVLLGWARPPAYDTVGVGEVALRVNLDREHFDRELQAALSALQRASERGGPR